MQGANDRRSMEELIGLGVMNSNPDATAIPVRSGVDFDLLEVSSFSVDRVPLGPDSVDSQ